MRDPCSGGENVWVLLSDSDNEFVEKGGESRKLPVLVASSSADVSRYVRGLLSGISVEFQRKS